jgi:hypothetical protein
VIAARSVLSNLVLPLALSGCATDLRVGVDTEAASSGAQASEGEAGSSSALADGGSASEAEAGHGTEEGGEEEGVGSSSTEPDPTVAVSVSSDGGESGLEPSTTSTGEPATESIGEATGEATGDPPGDCTAETQEQCLENPICVWTGEPGVCGIDPCEDPGNECLELGFEPCVDAIQCAWVGRPKAGECGAIACVPCEVLTADQCNRVEGCEYIEGEMACV